MKTLKLNVPFEIEVADVVEEADNATIAAAVSRLFGGGPHLRVQIRNDKAAPMVGNNSAEGRDWLSFTRDIRFEALTRVARIICEESFSRADPTV